VYSKGTEFFDAPIIETGVFDQPAPGIFCNGPRMHEFLREMNTEVLSKYDTMTVGELPHTPDPAHVLKYISSSDKQLNCVFQFDIVDIGAGKTNKYEHEGYKLSELKAIIAKWQSFTNGTDAWATAFCENHDQGRSVSRYASDAPEYRVKSAKMLALMMAAMTGTLFIYQGQEIGMINAPKDWPIEDYKDIESLNYYNWVKERTGGNLADLARVMAGIQILGRDHARLPMQWENTPHAGFSKSAKPWMRVHDLYPEINVADQARDPTSVLSFWKGMLKLRKEYRDVFIYGDFAAVDMDNEDTFVFTKEGGGKKVVVACNFTGGEQKWNLPPGEAVEKLVVGSQGEGEVGILRPWEGRIYALQGGCREGD
jgi:oligo-1,6-glucosidase